MTIIIAANDEVDAELEELAENYDRARNTAERERIADSVYLLIGNRIKSMVKRVSQNWRLGADDLDGLAREAVIEALENSGVTRLKRMDGTWENFVERCKRGHPVAKRVWNNLSPDLRKILESPYLKATTAEQLVRELNGMLRRRDFFNSTTWVGVLLPGEARILLDKGVANLTGTELSRFNALALGAACPEITVPNQPPPRSILGYVSKFWLPSAKARIADLGGARSMSEYMIEARNALQPVIEKLRQMEASGTMPPELARMAPAQRVYTLHRQMQQQQYGPIIQWWNERIRQLQPGHPFTVNSPSSLRDAKALFAQHPGQVPESLWKTKGSPNFLPVSVFEPFGLSIVQRVLDHASGAVGHARPEASSPGSHSQGDMTAAELLRGGHQSPAFRWLVESLFNQGEAEFAVGMFVAQHPSPSRQEIARFTQSLPPDIAEDIEDYGFNELVQTVDRAVLNEIRDPQVQGELMRLFGTANAEAMIDGVRRTVFCRTQRYIQLQVA